MQGLKLIRQLQIIDITDICIWGSVLLRYLHNLPRRTDATVAVRRLPNRE